MKESHKFFSTNDNVRLHYVEAGEKNKTVIVLIHGWAQSADSFKNQVKELSEKYHIYAIDLRGHGESEKPEEGYRIFRLSKDIHDFIEYLDLKDIVILGHSMGCAVIWGYWELFRNERLSKIVLVDEMASVAGNPVLSEEEKINYGPIFDTTALYSMYKDFLGQDGVAVADNFVAPMCTDNISKELLDKLLEESHKLPIDKAAYLFLDHCLINWQDVIKTINIPTLVINGAISHVPYKSTEWISSVIPGCKLETFTAEEKGRHFMFLENPEKFNKIFENFVG
jgi:pimeloyl-ACP methyl ester carboxylesterase